MGQIAAAAGNPNTFAPDPSGFSGSEWATRFMGKGLQGLGKGLQNYQAQNDAMRQGGGGMMPSAPQQQPMVDPRYFLPQQSKGPNNLAFYGGS